MSKTLEERLSSHSDSFSGLLSLIPAKYYYDDDTKNQWNRKKQSKEEAQAARKAKFDPDTASSALDVSIQQVEKATEEDASEGDSEASESEEEEEEEEVEVATEPEVEVSNDEAAESDESVEDVTMEESVEPDTPASSVSVASVPEPDVKARALPISEVDDSDEELIGFDDEGNELRVEVEHKSRSEDASKSSTKAKSPKNEQAIQELRARLASRINELREKRKAPGSGADGAPLSRETILTARRQRQEATKAKKQLKRKREQETDEQEDDAEVVEGDDEPAAKGDNLVFSQVVFKDGQKASADLSSLDEAKTKKGPRDILGQLKHTQAKRAKIAALDKEKRDKVVEQSQWSKAILQSEGGKVRDDEAMLKKSLKQQKKSKKKSEREWQERKENVTKGIQIRQTKREENLALRREMKGVKGNAQRQAVKKKHKKRAGFEGSKGRSKGFKK